VFCLDSRNIVRERKYSWYDNQCTKIHDAEGNIPEARWRKYVHEIVDCITRENVMLDLLTIDAEAYFQIISILFFRGKVFEFLREDKLQ